VEGVLQLVKEGFGYLRSTKKDYEEQPTDAWVPLPIIRRHGLREGSMIVGKAFRQRSRGTHPGLEVVETVDGLAPEVAAQHPSLKDLTSVDPGERYVLAEPDGDIDLRIIDLLSPLGKGQRALIVAPPRTGKTVILEKIGNRICKAYPKTHLMVALVDERPEEATHFKRSVPPNAEVIASTNDEPGSRHLQVAELVVARAKRLLEAGRDVVVLIDSLTRLGRAYNLETKGSGRTLSGGLDAKVLEKPKAFFGAARKVENGGSLTIVATALVETGSRMDEVIFEEFKGTGNMELVLSRTLAERRIYPAIDVNRSGTRREELLVSPSDLAKMHLLRRVLNRMRPVEAMELLRKKIMGTRSNEEFLSRFDQLGNAIDD
jgi:transcription termination factor Rho